MSEEAAKSEHVHTTPSRENQKCSKEGCKRPYRAKGYCNVHYRAWRHGELPKGRYKICTKEGCRKARLKEKGSFCAEHATGAPAAA